MSNFATGWMLYPAIASSTGTAPFLWANLRPKSTRPFSEHRPKHCPSLPSYPRRLSCHQRCWWCSRPKHSWCHSHRAALRTTWTNWIIYIYIYYLYVIYIYIRLSNIYICIVFWWYWMPTCWNSIAIKSVRAPQNSYCGTWICGTMCGEALLVTLEVIRNWDLQVTKDRLLAHTHSTCRAPLHTQHWTKTTATVTPTFIGPYLSMKKHTDP